MLEQFDVTNAFTESEIDNVVYAEPPEGNYPQHIFDGTPCVLKLNKPFMIMALSKPHACGNLNFDHT